MSQRSRYRCGQLSAGVRPGPTVESASRFPTVFGEVTGSALERAGFGDVECVTFTLPAVFLQATMGSSFTSGIGLVSDLENGTFEKTTATPMSWTAVLVGKAASGLRRIVEQVLVVLALGVAMGARVQPGALGVLGIVFVCVLIALRFMSISNGLGVLTHDAEASNAASMLFVEPNASRGRHHRVLARSCRQRHRRLRTRDCRSAVRVV